MAFASDKGRQGAAGQGAASFSIDNSLRFNDDDSAYLSWTPSSAGNRKTWTFSCWVKRGKLGSMMTLFAGVGSNISNLDFYSTADTLRAEMPGTVRTTQVFRDPSAWYHIVWMQDTTQAIAANRIKLYVNGTQITDFGVEEYPAQHAERAINLNAEHKIGAYSGYFDGYLAEVHFIDGTALDHTSFGEEDADYKHWKPKAYDTADGAYSTNGFHLDFKVAGTGTTGAGKDVSGEGNHWSTSGIASTDQMLDSPTNNFCTLNPIGKLQSSYTSGTISEGNLKVHYGSPDAENFCTMAVSTGKWYWELYTAVSSRAPNASLVELEQHKGGGGTRSYLGMSGGTPTVYENGSENFSATSIPSFTSTDVVGVAGL